MLKEAGFLFGCFFVHAGTHESALEKAVPFIYFFGYLAPRVRQIKLIVLRQEKTAFFQQCDGAADAGFDA